MDNQFEFKATYGSCLTPCDCFYYNGWYCVEGSVNVNYTPEEINTDSRVNVELLSDTDFFTASKAIESLDELIEQVES